MTEAEWLASTDMFEMLRFLRGEQELARLDTDHRSRHISGRGDLVDGEPRLVSTQKLAHFARECCKGWWNLPLDGPSRTVILAYQRFLDGEITREEFQTACVETSRELSEGKSIVLLIGHAFRWAPTPHGVYTQVQNLAWATACHAHRDRITELERTATEDELFAWGFFGYDFPEFGATAAEVYRPLPALLREVVGPMPFRTVTVNRGWLTSTVVALARQMYDSRDFGAMPILADALQDAGCDNDDILSHCRGDGPHVRGCWVVDLVLGKE